MHIQVMQQSKSLAAMVRKSPGALQGSVVTHLRCGGILRTLLQIYWYVWQLMKHAYWSMYGKGTDNSHSE